MPPIFMFGLHVFARVDDTAEPYLIHSKANLCHLFSLRECGKSAEFWGAQNIHYGDYTGEKKKKPCKDKILQLLRMGLLRVPDAVLRSYSGLIMDLNHQISRMATEVSLEYTDEQRMEMLLGLQTQTIEFRMCKILVIIPVVVLAGWRGLSGLRGRTNTNYGSSTRAEGY